MPLEKSQAVVDRARTSTDQFAPRRPPRIGDVFAVYGPVTEDLGKRHASVGHLGGARRAAKAALYGAVASTVPDEYAVEMAIYEETVEEPYSQGVFDVRQRSPKDIEDDISGDE